jgi:hypothetical protein
MRDGCTRQMPPVVMYDRKSTSTHGTVLPRQVRLGSNARVNSTDYIVKTTKGSEELKNRALKLPQRLRTMLIMVDGSLNAEQLSEAGAKLGAPGDFLATLERHGLVSARAPIKRVDIATDPQERPQPEPEAEADRFRAAQKFMNDTVVDALGFRAFFFTLKLERCFARADLSALLDDYSKAIAKGSGEDVARVLGTRARALLA